jgi:4-amino-4-deoxy-L-arabinose transferase-like glycosyltransferase
MSTATTPSQTQSTEHQRIALGWLCLLVAAWLLPGLIGHDPWKPDEAYSFGIVYSMLESGEWIVPMLAHEPFVEKPPLYYLTAAAFATILSPPFALHDAARLTTAFYMALAFGFIGAAARELYGTHRGPLAVLTLMGCLGLLIRSHQLITDIALLAGFAVGLYGFALALRRPLLGGFWLGTGVGIGFMAKGLLAPGVFGVTALLLPIFPAWRTREYLLCLAIALLACLPWLIVWPLALYLQSPALFHEWLWVNNFGRFFGTNDYGPPADTAHYLRILPWYSLPALPLAAWALWRVRKGGIFDAPYALPLTVFVVLLAVLSISADARELYALPLLLPLALLATPASETLRRGAANLIYWFSVMGYTFFILVAWFYWGALELGIPPKLHAHLHNNLQPGYTPGFRWLHFTIGVLYTAGWVVLLRKLGKSRERPIVAWTAGMTVVWGLLASLFIGWVDVGKSYRGMIGDLQKALPAKYDCIASRNLGEPQRGMLHYFAGIVTWRIEVPGRQRECQLMLVHGVSSEEQVPLGPWQKIWEGARPGDKLERYRLYQRTAAKARK